MEVGQLGIYYTGIGKAYRVRIMREYVTTYELVFVDAPDKYWYLTSSKNHVIPYPPEMERQDMTAYAKVMWKLR